MPAMPPPRGSRGSIFKRIFNAFASPEPPAAKPFAEMGTSGTAVYGGFISSKERSAQWVGGQKYVTIADMAINASIVAAGVHYFLNLIAHPRWTFEPADDSPEAEAAAELVDSALNGMDQSWSSVVRRAGIYRFYGFGLQEWTASRRADGKVGLKSIEPRPQATVEQWSVDPNGSVTGAWQRAPQTGELLGIPRSKFLYLVDDALSDSPEGTGIFRHLAEPWERLKAYYVLEARAFERDLRGVPVGRVPYAFLQEQVEAGTLTKARAEEMAEVVESFAKLQVKQSDTAITLDSDPYYSQAADGSKVAGLQKWGLELLQGGAAGMAEVAAAITRTQTEMARVMACEGLMMGESSGNRSLGEDKSRNLYLIGNSVLSDIVGGVKRDIIPAVCDLNGIPEALRPVPEVEDIAFKSAETVARILAQMAQAGAVLAPDDPVVEDVRSLMGVSPPPPPSPEMMGVAGLRGPGGAGGALGGGSPPQASTGPAVGPGEAPQGAELASKSADVEVAGSLGMRTLYVSRRLLNEGAVRAWAASQGFELALPAGEMHVTVAYSKDPVDWSRIEPDRDALAVQGGVRSVHQFDGGAVVLTLESPELRRRWQELRDAGASWDYPDYRPHVTITYSGAPADLSAVEPYRGPLIFGPEEMEEIDSEGFDPDSIEEEAILKTLYKMND